MSNDQEHVSLTSLGHQVMKLFRLLIVTEARVLNNNEERLREWSPGSFQSQADRFELWAVNLGVFVPGHGSLDYRVRDADIIKDSLRSFMGDLQTSIDDTLQYLEGNLETDGDDSDMDSDPETDFELLLDTVKDPIDRLYKLSTWIRSPVTRLTSSKARNFQQVDEESGEDLFKAFRTFDIEHVRSIFLGYGKQRALEEEQPFPPTLPLVTRGSLEYEETGSYELVWEPIGQLLSRNRIEVRDGTESFLIHRIAEANILRRRQFAYWKYHKSKLDEHAKVHLQNIPTLEEINEPQKPFEYTAELRQQNEDHGHGLEVPSVTTATQLRIPHAFFNENRSTVSVSEYAPSNWRPGSDKITFPPPPKVADESEVFECPYCFLLCPTTLLSEKAWKAHLIRDLRPYICTYEQCHTSLQLYDNYGEWLQHENFSHRRVFRCPEHDSQTFLTYQTYQTHIDEHHGGSTSSEGKAIREVSESTVEQVDRSCPVCSAYFETAQKLQTHIARHLERFSIFSLPKSVTGSEENSSVSGPASSRLNSGGSSEIADNSDLNSTRDELYTASGSVEGEEEEEEREEGEGEEWKEEEEEGEKGKCHIYREGGIILWNCHLCEGGPWIWDTTPACIYCSHPRCSDCNIMS